MSANGLEHKFQRIIENNPELVAEYDSIDSNIPLEYSFDEIEIAYNNLKQVDRSVEFSYTIKTAIQNAVKYEQNVVE